MTTAIHARHIEVYYGDSIALSNVDLAVPRGSSLAVIGTNGSGKSTLLKVIAGTLAPTSGELTVSGPPPAFVLQSTEVDTGLPITVRDTISLARYPSLGLFKRFQSRDREVIDQAMARMAIEDLAERQLHELSGGQRQRVLVAQGLAQDSAILLLDEPATGLDLTSRAIILDMVDEETAAGRTVVLTTHNLDDARRCDDVLLLNTTPVVLGPPSEVLTEQHLRTAFGRQFIRVGDGLMLDDPHHHSH